MKWMRCKNDDGLISPGEEEDGERSSEGKKKTQSAQTCEEEEGEGGQNKEQMMTMRMTSKCCQTQSFSKLGSSSCTAAPFELCS